jgi:hypothetical protein
LPRDFVAVKLHPHAGGNHLLLELADVIPLVCEWIDARTLIARL